MERRFQHSYPAPTVLAEIARTQIAYVRAVARVRCICSELIAGLSTAAFPAIQRLSDSALIEVTLQIARERLVERETLLREVAAAVSELGSVIADRNSLVHDEISSLGGAPGADFAVRSFKKAGLGDDRFSEQETWWDEPTLRQHRERLEDLTITIDDLRHKLDYGRIPLAARYRPRVWPDEIVWRTAARKTKGLPRGAKATLPKEAAEWLAKTKAKAKAPRGS